MNTIQKCWGHLRTVLRHRHQVILHCCRAGILSQGLRHDLSKFSPTEFCPGVRYYQGTRSPNEGEREAFGYSLAWMHHKGRNRHHFEYWTDYNPATRNVEPVEMPVRYVVEMFCDRVAASKIYQKDAYRPDSALRYFLNAKPRRKIHPATSDLLEHLLTMVAEQGEDATFAEARRLVRADRAQRKQAKRK